jgi:structure-specific recognition protein 1
MEKVEKNLGNTASKNIGSFVKGWSWGEIKISQDQIYFEVSDQSWFTIPYSGISNALVPTKNELGLEFNIEEEDSK